MDTSKAPITREVPPAWCDNISLGFLQIFLQKNKLRLLFEFEELLKIRSMLGYIHLGPFLLTHSVIYNLCLGHVFAK